MKDARRGLARLREDGADLRVRLEGTRHRHRLDRPPPLDDHLVYDDAVALADLRPALAELAPVDNHHLVPRREEIGDRALHGAGARGGEHEHVLAGPEELAQPLLYLAQHPAALRRP